jgi:hypothetical protein
MPSNGFEPVACKVVPHGLSDDGQWLHLRVSFSPRANAGSGNAPPAIDPTVYADFWSEWPARLYSGWKVGLVHLIWQDKSAAPATNSVALNSGVVKVATPKAGGHATVPEDNALSWLTGTVSTAKPSPPLGDVWRALTSSQNSLKNLTVFKARDQTGTPPLVTASTCTSNARLTYERIKAAVSLQSTLKQQSDIEIKSRASGDQEHQFALQKLQTRIGVLAAKVTTPFLIQRHDLRTEEVIVPNLCGLDDTHCTLRKQLRQLLDQALAGDAKAVEKARAVERDLARLCQSGHTFEDLTCSALLTVFYRLRNTYTCPVCNQPPVTPPGSTQPLPESVSWSASAVYRGTAQTAATRANIARIKKARENALKGEATENSKPISVPHDGSELDAKAILSLANDRLLAELFGLVLDIQVSKAAIESSLGAGVVQQLLSEPSIVRLGFVANAPGSGGTIVYESYSPCTVCAVGAFLPEEVSDPNSSRLIQDGFLRIGDDDQFAATDVSYTTIQTNYRLWHSQTAAHLHKLKRLTDSALAIQPTTPVRTQRFILAKLSAAFKDFPEVPEPIDALIEIYYANAGSRLTIRLTSEADQQLPGNDGRAIYLYANDLIRGYGLDVNMGGNQWSSQTYSTEIRKVTLDTTWTTLVDGAEDVEGFVKWAPHQRADAAGDPNASSPPDDLHAPENMSTWDGFGPRAEHPGTAYTSDDTDPDAHHRALERNTDLPRTKRFSPLRYDTEVPVRIPVFDVTGVRLGCANPATINASTVRKVPVTRHKRVKPPELLVVNPSKGKNAFGETLEQVVIRTGAHQTDEYRERVLVPPRVAENIAYAHGAFDISAGGKPLRDSGTFRDVGLIRRVTSESDGAGQPGSKITPVKYVSFVFPQTDDKHIPPLQPVFADPVHLPTGAYWPDPKSLAALVSITNRVTGDRLVFRLPFYRQTRWPDARRALLHVNRGNEGQSYKVEHQITDGRDQVYIRMPPGHQVEVVIQSASNGTYYEGTTNPPDVSLKGFFVEHPKISYSATDTAEQLQWSAVFGDPPTLPEQFDSTFPTRSMDLIHAVDHPLKAPAVTAFAFRQIIAAYSAVASHANSPVVANSTVAFKGSLAIDYKTTGKTTLYAAWEEKTLKNGGVEVSHTEAPIDVLDTSKITELNRKSLDLVEDVDADYLAKQVPDWTDTSANPSHFIAYDARPPRARSAKVFAKAGMRDEFSKYFPTPAPALVTGPSFPVQWLNSLRPTPPRLKHSTHSFIRYFGPARNGRRRSSSSKESARTDPGLCIYVDEPLQSSGERGLLGVVLWQQPRSETRSYALSRDSSMLSTDAQPATAGLNFSPDYLVPGAGSAAKVPGARTLDRISYCKPTCSSVTRWAGDIFENYPLVTTMAPGLANFVLQGDDDKECNDPYTNKSKRYSVTVADYVSVGGLEEFESDPTKPLPTDHNMDGLPTYPFTILGYEPQYDSVAKLYYYEIRFRDFPTETFVKLALVYFQPNSLRFAECSDVVFAPFIKPLGDRFTVVTPVGLFSRDFTVDVYGRADEKALIADHGTFSIEVLCKDRRNAQGLHAKTEGTNSAVTLTPLDPADRGPSCLWSARLSIADSNLYEPRIVIKEGRLYGQPGSVSPEKGVGEVLVYWEQFTP